VNIRNNRVGRHDEDPAELARRASSMAAANPCEPRRVRRSYRLPRPWEAVPTGVETSPASPRGFSLSTTRLAIPQKSHDLPSGNQREL
jgi:hypothetical protein